MTELVQKSISELKTILSQKEASAVDVLNCHLKQIEKHESKIQAFNSLTVELARKQAEAIDRMIQKGETLPALAGVPIAIKDNMCVSGYPTTCSSRILENFIPSYNATAVQRLFQAGAICLGKTNLDEFAMGASTENSAFKLTRNPWDLKRVPGGSSGGSAAAVCAGFTMGALGSDTGGSIRQPASFCGIVGMKPTYGMVSRFGLVAFASSLDQIGPLGRSVEDVATILSVVAGHDRKDSTALNVASAPEFQELANITNILSERSPDQLVSGLKIGIMSELIGEGIQPDVRQSVLAASEVFEKLGVRLEEVSVPHAKYALSVYYIICTAEACANLARYDGVKYGYRSQAESQDIVTMYKATRNQGFGPEVTRRIMLGTYALSSGYYDAYYKKAQQVRRLLKDDFDRVFKKFDLILCAVAPSVAFEIGEKTNDPLQMYLSDIATIPANLAGIPGISVPCGFDKSNLPIGLQILGKPLADASILKAAHAFERSTDFNTHKSPILNAARTG